MKGVRRWGASRDGAWWRGRYLRPRRGAARRAETAMSDALRAHGFKLLTYGETSWQGVWANGSRRVVVTRIQQDGVAEAEVYDPRFRPDIRLAYNLAALESLLDRHPTGRTR